MKRSPLTVWSLVCAFAPVALPSASAAPQPQPQVVPAQPAQPAQAKPVQVQPVQPVPVAPPPPPLPVLVPLQIQAVQVQAVQVQPVQVQPVQVQPVQVQPVQVQPVQVQPVQPAQFAPPPPVAVVRPDGRRIAPPAMPQPVKDGKEAADGLTLLIEHYLDPVDAPDVARRLPCKIHAVKLDKDSPYQIDLVGHGIDAYLRLLDEHGKMLAEDDDSGGNLNARIRHTTTKGGLFFIVATTCAGGEGAYTLSVRKLQPVALRKAAAMNPVAAKKPSEVKARLNANDPADEARSVPCQVHSIALKANKTYVIDLESTDFDAYLRLESPTGGNIQEDDDSGGNLNSRIEYRVPADGNYRLVAMPLHNLNLNGNAGGQYTLRVTEKE